MRTSRASAAQRSPARPLRSSLVSYFFQGMVFTWVENVGRGRIVSANSEETCIRLIRLEPGFADWLARIPRIRQIGFRVGTRGSKAACFGTRGSEAPVCSRLVPEPGVSRLPVVEPGVLRHLCAPGWCRNLGFRGCLLWTPGVTATPRLLHSNHLGTLSISHAKP